MKASEKIGATIKAIDFDLINGITKLMVGSKVVELNLNEYRLFKSLARDWTSGVKQVKDLVWYYSRKNVISHIAYGNGAAACSIEILLGIMYNR